MDEKAETSSRVAEDKLSAVLTGENTANPKSKATNEHVSDFAREHITGGWRPGMDPKVDYSGHFEFGGSLGTLALMTGFPLLMYYM
ncbi:hypothetical protein GJ744_003198 [Endocarpon pusillum]|uniref:Uncharacterized protein n=1 Tax=Endocarpon pusillum TaxID=364733 RepID=A0A8H7AMJ7_9EURO|nr:hypothetical protein GJ744_003198 [Endocarpon pusillum]